MNSLIQPKNAIVEMFIETCRRYLNDGETTVPFTDGITAAKLDNSVEWQGFVGRLQAIISLDECRLTGANAVFVLLAPASEST